MSPSAYIVTRTTRDGERRYQVRFRLGGAESKPQSAGTFKTRKEAEARRQWVMGEIAAMRVPDLAALTRPPRTLARVAEEWLSGRVHITGSTPRLDRQSLAYILPTFGDRDPAGITFSEVQAWIGGLTARGLSPNTIAAYIKPLRGILDHADLAKNPARDPRIRLPRLEEGEVTVPTWEHLEAMAALLPPWHRLVVIVLEQTMMRVGETYKLGWGDLDAAGSRFRIAAGMGKRRTAARRWVPVPAELLDVVEALVPREDRTPEARIFGRGPSPDHDIDALEKAMRRACGLAGVPAYTPHDLRSRRITIRIMRGDDPVQVAREAGHRKLSMTLDVYTRLLPPETPPPLSDVLARWLQSPVSHGAPVVPRA